jgi:hypothetical protein
MRRLAIRLLLFVAVVEGLGRVDFMVMLSALGLLIAVIVCTDLFMNPSSRAR